MASGKLPDGVYPALSTSGGALEVPGRLPQQPAIPLTH